MILQKSYLYAILHITYYDRIMQVRYSLATMHKKVIFLFTKKHLLQIFLNIRFAHKLLVLISTPMEME